VVATFDYCLIVLIIVTVLHNEHYANNALYQQLTPPLPRHQNVSRIFATWWRRVVILFVAFCVFLFLFFM